MRQRKHVSRPKINPTESQPPTGKKEKKNKHVHICMYVFIGKRNRAEIPDLTLLPQQQQQQNE